MASTAIERVLFYKGWSQRSKWGSTGLDRLHSESIALLGDLRRQGLYTGPECTITKHEWSDNPERVLSEAEQAHRGKLRIFLVGFSLGVGAAHEFAKLACKNDHDLCEFHNIDGHPHTMVVPHWLGRTVPILPVITNTVTSLKPIRDMKPFVIPATPVRDRGKKPKVFIGSYRQGGFLAGHEARPADAHNAILRDEFFKDQTHASIDENWHIHDFILNRMRGFYTNTGEIYQ